MKITRVNEDKVEEAITKLRNREKELGGDKNILPRIAGEIGGITADILEIMVRLQRIEDKLKEEKDG